MGVVIKLHGKHIVAGGQLTLLDNYQESVGCSAGSTYSEYSDVTQIIISPQGSNTIGGAGSAWKIEGSITIDGAVVDLYVGASAPVPSVAPAIPIAVESGSVASEVAMSNVAESVADITSCKIYITDRLASETTNYEIVGKNDGADLGSGYQLGLALHESAGAIAFSVKLRYAGASDITKIVITSVSAGTHTFE